MTGEIVTVGTGGLIDQWASWLDTGWEWDWFFTGTFAPPEPGARGTHTVVGWRGSERRYARWVQQLADKGSEPYWFRARERHQFRNATHFHALVGGVGKLSRRDAWADWFQANGQCRIEPIRSGNDVALYVAKYVLKAEGQVEFSDNAGRFSRGNLVLGLRP